VLGIISSDYEEVTGSSHISFIAINDLKSDIQRAANGEKELYLGVTGININKDAGTELGVDSGVYITRVEANSPALSAGLRVTDIITDINKESDITMKKLHEILNSAKSGDKLKLKVLRGGKDKKEIEVVVK
ncbi:MAG: PDZ domain-containing protein, partial [Lachnospiraceae bacterium]|nr:PDZ domain-containing protein [Lachnospiraceae bacterium]